MQSNLFKNCSKPLAGALYIKIKLNTNLDSICIAQGFCIFIHAVTHYIFFQQGLLHAFNFFLQKYNPED